MYPEHPKSPADLVPLPTVEGPKLKPFDFQGQKQDIEFLYFCGAGLHSMVFRVRIHSQIYALKLFRFCDYGWLGPISDQIENKDIDVIRACYPYSEPFSAECRAYGRLQETGHEELSVKCFGYLLLDEDNEKALQKRFEGADRLHGLDVTCTGSWDDYMGWPTVDMRALFPCKDGRPAPIRGIVKEFGDSDEFTLPFLTAKNMLHDMVYLQQLGIFHLDTRTDQVVNGKHGDFSTAITTPHFLTSPELNPKLDSKMIRCMERQTFVYTMEDYWQFETMIFSWNYDHEDEPEVHLDIHALPLSSGAFRNRLRQTKSRSKYFALVDPRARDWRNMSPGATSPLRVTKSRRQPCQNGRRSVHRKRGLRLSNTPKRWYFGGSEQDEAHIKRAQMSSHFFGWKVEEGLIFPDI